MVESDSHTSNEANEQEKRRDRNYKGLQAHDRRRDEEIGQGGNMCSVNYFGFINSACLIRLSCFPQPHGCTPLSSPVMALQRPWPFIHYSIQMTPPKDPKISLAAPKLPHQIFLFGHVPRSHSRASNRRRRNTDATDAVVTPAQ